MRKAKKRIVLSLKEFLLDKDFELLFDRLRFLSCSTRMKKVGRKMPVFTGYRHVYRLCSEDAISEQLSKIDAFLHGIINSKRFSLLDLTSCPFLTNPEKDALIEAAMRHENQNVPLADIGHFRNFVSGHSWFFNWKPATPAVMKAVPEREGDEANPNYDLARHEMLHAHLLKKQLLLAY